MHNTLWYNTFAYTHVFYQPQGLSDHSPISLDFPTCPKTKPSFQFCDMWITDPQFLELVAMNVDKQPCVSKL